MQVSVYLFLTSSLNIKYIIVTIITDHCKVLLIKSILKLKFKLVCKNMLQLFSLL